MHKMPCMPAHLRRPFMNLHEKPREVKTLPDLVFWPFLPAPEGVAGHVARGGLAHDGYEVAHPVDPDASDGWDRQRTGRPAAGYEPDIKAQATEKARDVPVFRAAEVGEAPARDLPLAHADAARPQEGGRAGRAAR